MVAIKKFIKFVNDRNGNQFCEKNYINVQQDSVASREIAKLRSELVFPSQ